MTTSAPPKSANAPSLPGWDLSGKNYVVTGGAKGIGLATVKALLAKRARKLVFCSRGPCEDVLILLKKDFPDSILHHVECDVSTDEGRQTLRDFTEQRLEGDQLHGLINNVGMNIRKTIVDQSWEDYEKIMRTNIDSAYFLCKLLLDLFSSTGATIVNVSSAAGVQSSGTGAAYGMSKAALNQLTRALACEWAARNIRVNAVTPWMTMTPMLEDAIKANPSQLDKVKAWTPMRRLGTAEEIAAPIVFLCLPCSSYITGQILGVDGGLTAQGFDGPCVTSEM